MYRVLALRFGVKKYSLPKDINNARSYKACIRLQMNGWLPKVWGTFLEFP